MKHLSLFYLCISVCVWGGYFIRRGTEPQQIQVFMYYFCFLELCHEIYQNSNSESCHHVE